MSSARGGIALIALVLAGCSTKAANTPPKVPVTVATAERRAVPWQIEASGTVEPVKSVEVTAQLEGLVTGVRFEEGQEVAAGQVLFEVDPRPYRAALAQAEANLRRDLVQAASAEREAERYRVLADSLFSTREDYQQKRAAADAFMATVHADSAALAAATLNLEYATVRAPIAGRTGRLLVHEGNLVKSGGDPLVTINQMRPIYVQFAVPASQLPDLLERRGRALRVLAHTGRADAPDLEGVLSFLDNEVDAATGTLMLKARFPNEDGALWPGEFVSVTLVLDVEPDATVVPVSAVMNGQAGSYVFVVNAEGKAESHPVTVARTLDSLAVISKGIAPGDQVVTDGQLRLTPNAPVQVRGGKDDNGAKGAAAGGAAGR